MVGRGIGLYFLVLLCVVGLVAGQIPNNGNYTVTDLFTTTSNISIAAPTTSQLIINVENNLGPTIVVVNTGATEVVFQLTLYASSQNALNTLLSNQPTSASTSNGNTVSLTLSGSTNIPMSILGRTCTMGDLNLDNSRPSCEPLRFTPSSSYSYTEASDTTPLLGVRLTVIVPESSQTCINSYCASSLYYALTDISPQNFQDLGNGIIYDSIQGLMWSETFLTDEYPYDGANGNNFPSINAGIHACINTQLGGFQDWRLPTRSELHRIMDHGKGRPALDSKWWTFNSNRTTDAGIWTTVRTRVQDYQGVFFIIAGGDGGIYYGPDVGYTKLQIVKCVRTVVNKIPNLPRAPRFINNTDYAIDTWTGLQWPKSYLEPATPAANGTAPGESYCSDLRTDRKSDWRLPNNKESASFMDESRAGPCYDISVFPHDSGSSDWFWCTNYNVAFGTLYWAWNGGDGTCYVQVSPGKSRCVRGPDFTVPKPDTEATHGRITNGARQINDNQIRPTTTYSSSEDSAGTSTGSSSSLSSWVRVIID